MIIGVDDDDVGFACSRESEIRKRDEDEQGFLHKDGDVYQIRIRMVSLRDHNAIFESL